MKKNLILLLSILLIAGCFFTSCNQNPVYCTVKFKGAGDIPDQVVPKGGRASEPKISIAKVPYKFVGWTLDGDAFDCNTDTVTRDIVLVACWEAQCTVVFDSKGGSEIEPQIVALGAKAKKPQDPTRAGYTFKGWYVEGNPSFDFDVDVVDSTYLVLSASWEAKEVYVSYDANGGTFIKESDRPETQTVVFGSTITIADISSSKFKKTGYYLEGWTLDKEGTGTVYQAGDEVPVSPENMILFAKWSEPKKEASGNQKGAAGGYIIYDCDADNVIDADGKISAGPDGLMSSVCGWRYIEAAPGPLSGSYCYGYYRYNGTTTENHVFEADGKDIGDGKTNTEKIYHTSGYAYLEPAPTTETVTDKDGNTETKTINPEGDCAAKICYDYSMQNSQGMTYDDWYLPSEEEFLQLFWAHEFDPARQNLPTGRYITSTEVDETKNMFFTAITSSTEMPRYSTFESDKSKTGTVFPIRYF